MSLGAGIGSRRPGGDRPGDMGTALTAAFGSPVSRRASTYPSRQSGADVGHLVWHGFPARVGADRHGQDARATRGIPPVPPHEPRAIHGCVAYPPATGPTRRRESVAIPSSARPASRRHQPLHCTRARTLPALGRGHDLSLNRPTTAPIVPRSGISPLLRLCACIHAFKAPRPPDFSPRILYL